MTLLTIDGEAVGARAEEELAVEDPSTGEIVRRVPLGRAADAEAAVEAARRAFDDGPWPAMTPRERGAILRRLGELLEEQADLFAQLCEDELGAPRQIVKRAHALRGLEHWHDLVERGSHGLGHALPTLDGPVSTAQMVLREPRGVVCAIVPWNFPHVLNLWKVAAALVTGNTVVLKPALETPSPALELGRLALAAGVPPGVLNVVTGGPDVGEAMVSDPRVDVITFTGSTAVGRRIAATASGTLKHVILELGGKSAQLVLGDAEIAGVVERSTRFMFNSGQGCALETRLLLPDSIFDEVVERLVTAVSRVKVGSAHDETVHMGPVISSSHRQRVESYIALGQEEGAKIVVGGGRPAVAENGWYVEPTIFTEVENRMRIAREEIFGPVLCVIRYSGDPEEGVAIANDSDFGLAGSVWTRNIQLGLQLARRIRAGQVTVNAVAPSPHGPFGGYKQSGRGRELGQIGLEEYTEVKHVAWMSG